MMDINDFITLFIPIFLLILGIGFFFRGLHFRNVVLAIYFILTAYLQFNLNIIASNYYVKIPHILFTHFLVGPCLGPLIYFFVLSITDNKNKIEKWDFLHFISPTICLIVFTPVFLSSADEKIALLHDFLTGKYSFFRFVIMFFMSVFVIYTFVSIYKIYKNYKKENQYHRKIIILLVILTIWLIFVFLKAAAVIIMSYRLFGVSNLLLFTNLIFVYFSYQKYPNLFLYGVVNKGMNESKISLLTKIDTNSLKNQLEALMFEEKFYCDEDLSLNRLSEALAITPHQLSEFLNSLYNKNFNAFINSYRIEESKNLLLENMQRNTLSIAYAVGFNSYTAFYNAFKNTIGLSPADFRKKYKSKSTKK